MREGITPPKLAGHEDENVFDLDAYRALVLSQKAEERFKQVLLEHFDEIAPILSRMENARDAVELTAELDTLTDSIVIAVHESIKKHLAPDTMAEIGRLLDTARRFAIGACAMQRDGADPKEYANLTRETKAAAVGALRLLITSLSAARKPQE